MYRSFLGKNHLHWCDVCKTPVLGKKCGCGTPTREVVLTPPGDIRPAFEDDITHINQVYREHFGVDLIPEGHLVILNKVPDIDRMEEIIMGGAVVGAIRFYPDEERWEAMPRPPAALYMSPSMRYVVVDPGAETSIQTKGASVLAPGLITIEEHVEDGDQVFIMIPDGRCIAVGRAKVSAKEAQSMERGTIVRTRKTKPVICVPAKRTWEDALAANEQILTNIEEEAIDFVKRTMETNPLPANVSYSGGKDSLATLLIVMKAAGKLPLLFADTGLEFKETYENVQTVADYYGLEVIRTETASRFWEVMEEEGPPAVDARWCCSVCKLHPIKALIEERWGECLSFIGQRKYESFKRMKSPRVWRSHNIPCQLSASPIQHWTALHVWLYIFRENAPYNVLYTRRIDRIGCFMCPSSDWATLRLIMRDYPDEWKRWDDALNQYKEKHNLPDVWVEKALWRVRGEGEEENDDESSYT
jgi:phosphoadenosine phosphosulfate reductase